MANNRIISRKENFADWYTSVINEANLVQYTDMKGFTIFEPNGWRIWERIRNDLDVKFKAMGINNLYMPLLIPMSEFQKEKEHVEGFAPELFTVTQIGDKKLDDLLVIRPTSEIWFCKYFKNKIKSYKDLPLLTNQWTSVLRAEKNTRPFLRNTEFHWHETHCAFASHQDADTFAKRFLDLYANFCENELCIPVIKGAKTVNERFAGATMTYTIESMMQDGQALQSATSHVLGQNFAIPYDIKFQDANNQLQYAYTTSHGLTTRIIGAIIMVHGDDNGLVLPFNIAECQIKIICLFANKNPQVYDYAKQIHDQLIKNYRCEIIDSDKGIGYLLAESEVQGTPINLVVGPQDLQDQTFTFIRRDDGVKHTTKIDELDLSIEAAVKEYKANLFNKAKQRLDNNIVMINNFDELKSVIDNKQWAKCYFNGSADDEQKIKELTGATARCILLEPSPVTKKCFYTGQDTNQIVIFAKAY